MINPGEAQPETEQAALLVSPIEGLGESVEDSKIYEEENEEDVDKNMECFEKKPQDNYGLNI